MGIYCKLFQITAHEAEQIWMDPEAISSIIEAKETALPARPSRERQLTLFDLPVPASPATWFVDLWQMRDALQFLLNNQEACGTSPLSRAVFGGELVRNQGQGTVKILGRAEVRAVLDALSALTHEELRRRFDPAKFAAAGIDPASNRDDDREQLFSGLTTDFDHLVAFYEGAARCGNAVLINTRSVKSLLRLRYGAIVVGEITDPFRDQNTWFGFFRHTVATPSHPTQQRLSDYIAFCKEWHVGIDLGEDVDASDFDRFGDVTTSGLWSTEAPDGTLREIHGAPVFYDGEVTWNYCPVDRGPGER